MPALTCSPSHRVADDPSLAHSPCLHWRDGRWTSAEETLAVESPLAIEIVFQRTGQPVKKRLAVTMRTPGHDADLALGFLFAEGLIGSCADVVANTSSAEPGLDVQVVQLAAAPREDLQRISRGLLTSSACGVCGRTSLEGLALRRIERTPQIARLDPGLIASLPNALRSRQPAFAATGGTHGAALCDATGAILLTREDVGRHNAVDKLVGAALQRQLSLATSLLVLSGRASFELVQKAAAAGIPIVAAVGAPSSLAVSLAHDTGLTLVGFVREQRFNVYTHADRLAVNA